MRLGVLEVGISNRIVAAGAKKPSLNRLVDRWTWRTEAAAFCSRKRTPAVTAWAATASRRSAASSTVRPKKPFA